MDIGETVKIEGVAYVILTARPYTHNGDKRIEYTMKRPRGQREYYVVQYGNGTLSGVV